LQSFGRNDYGQLGLGDTNIRVMPASFTLNEEEFKFAVAGRFHTLLIDQNNKLWACGNNHFGQLGLGDTENRLNPTKLPYFEVKTTLFRG
jgi:alpha-tubulin suppressor-like RCC1 family protein